MGHRQGDSRVYVQYYMSTFNDVDCQTICFGSAPQHDLIHLAGRLLRHGDAPTALTDQQKFEVNQDPDLVNYRRKRTQLLQQMKSQGYRSRADAEGTKLAARYDEYKKKADRLIKKLMTGRLQLAIKDFHDSVHVEEINRQLNGIKPADVIAPPTIQYDVPERARVAHLFSRAVEVRNRDELHPLRVDLVRTIARLCKRRESPCRRQAKRGRKSVVRRAVRFRSSSPSRTRPELRDNIASKPAAQVAPDAETSSRFCPFCRWANDGLGDSERDKLWRIDSLTRHLRTRHFRRRSPFKCPYNGCIAILANAGHFADHARRQHGLHLPASVISE